MSINDQGHSLTLVKGHSDFKVKCLNFGLYTQVSDSGPLGPLVVEKMREAFAFCTAKASHIFSTKNFAYLRLTFEILTKH